MPDDIPGQQSLAYHRGPAAPATARFVATATVIAGASSVACAGWFAARMYGAFTLATILQGVVVGCGMRWAIRSCRIRRRSVGRAATLLAAVAAVAGLYAALYVRYLWAAIQLNLHTFGRWWGPLGVRFLFDDALQQRTGRGGLAGYLIFLTPDVWSVAFAQLVVMPWSAWAVARREWAGVRCPSCGQRLPPPRNAAVVSTAATFDLIGAIVAGDTTAVLEVVTVSAGAELSYRCVVARAYRCRACGDRAVDVVAKTFGIDDGRTISLLPPTAVTEAMDDAVRGVAKPFPPLRLA